MEPKVMNREEIKIIGIEVRTNNNDEMNSKGKISQQWQKFYQEGLAAKIPNQVHPGTVLAVYTDYESDVTGEYSFVLGSEVRTFDDVPKGMVAKKLPAAKYAVFTSKQGPIPEIVIGIWKQIWSLKKNQVGGDRAYLADFEVYDEKSKDPKNAQVSVYLSIK